MDANYHLHTLQFSVDAEAGQGSIYKIAIYNGIPIVVPGWAYAEAEANKKIIIDPPKDFLIEPVEGIETKGIY
jgi:hypothetical protein